MTRNEATSLADITRYEIAKALDEVGWPSAQEYDATPTKEGKS